MSKTKWAISTPWRFLSVWLFDFPCSLFCVFLSLLSLGGQGLLQWRWPHSLAVCRILLVNHSCNFPQWGRISGALCSWPSLLAIHLPPAWLILLGEDLRGVCSPVSDKCKWPHLATDSWTFVVKCFSRNKFSILKIAVVHLILKRLKITQKAFPVAFLGQVVEKMMTNNLREHMSPVNMSNAPHSGFGLEQSSQMNLGLEGRQVCWYQTKSVWYSLFCGMSVLQWILINSPECFCVYIWRNHCFL